MILKVHVTTKDHAILLTGRMGTRDWIVQLIEYKMSFHMLTGFTGTSELLETEETLRAQAGH